MKYVYAYINISVYIILRGNQSLRIVLYITISVATIYQCIRSKPLRSVTTDTTLLKNCISRLLFNYTGQQNLTFFWHTRENI